MKKSTLLHTLLLTILVAGSGISSARADTYCGPLLWRDVKALARTCAAEEKSGRPCQDIRVFSHDAAAFTIGNSEFRVRMFESAYSDGGDLNDLVIDRADGCRLVRRNIPAYGDILEALAR